MHTVKKYEGGRGGPDALNLTRSDICPSHHMAARSAHKSERSCVQSTPDSMLSLLSNPNRRTFKIFFPFFFNRIFEQSADHQQSNLQ